MATYTDGKGTTIFTDGSVYRITYAGGYIKHTDLSKWTNDATQWIENDIKDGYYQGFRKVEI